MKLAFVNQPMGIVMPSEGPVGSIAIGLFERATRLARTHEVIVYCRARDERSIIRVEEAKGATFRGIPAQFDSWWNSKVARRAHRNQRRLEKLLGLKQTDRPFFAYRLFHWPYARRIADDLRQYDPDIVHIHMFFQAIPHIRARNPRARIVLHIHGEELTRIQPEPVERYLRHADLLLCVSDHIKRGIQANFPRLADRCQTLHNGVDIDRFAAVAEHNIQAPALETQRSLYVARVSPEKGVHTLLDAFQQVAAHYPNAQLDIIGSQKPVSHERLAALVAREHLDKMLTFYEDSRAYQAHLQAKVTGDLAQRVTFTGHLPHTEITDQFRDAYLLAQPSFSDAFPLSVLEGMACGVPVVGTRVGGIPEAVVDGETGLLVEAGDADGLAAALMSLLADPERRMAMGRAAHQRAVGVFAWDRVVETLEQKYEQLLL